MSIFFSQMLLPNNKKIICHCKNERQKPPIGEDRQLDLIDGGRKWKEKFKLKTNLGRIPPDGSYVGSSSCNEFTDRLGAGQKVLSYSYYTPGKYIPY